MEKSKRLKDPIYGYIKKKMENATLHLFSYN